MDYLDAADQLSCTQAVPVCRKTWTSFRKGVAITWRHLLLPCVLYTFIFLIVTFPAVRTFRSQLWAGPGDGLAIFWNLWWVDKALTDMHVHPWFTPYLFHPVGMPLFMHTMHPLKGLMAIPLHHFISPLCTYNLLLTLSFTFSGVTAFWLCHAFSRAYWPSFLGGCIFTFCNYHFAHAQGHLHLVSMEWVPVFLLFWYRLLTRPRVWDGLGASLALLCVLLCDSYYFMHCTIAGIVMVCWRMFRDRAPLFWLKRSYGVPLLSFLVPTLATCGVFAVCTVLAMSRNPPTAFSPAWTHSMDLLAPFIPGAHWRFGEWTRAYWARIPGAIHGNSVSIGLSVAALVCYGWRKRRDLDQPDVSLWFLLGAFFGVMALGPRLYIAGWRVPGIGDGSVPGLIMPYDMLEALIPPLKVGARPNRLVMIAILSAAVVATLAVKRLWRHFGGRSVLLGLILPLLVFEYLPSPLPSTTLATPAFVTYLAREAPPGALYDMSSPMQWAMYYQTIHQRPIPRALVSREPVHVVEAMEEIHAAAAAHRWQDLRIHGRYRFVLVPAGEAATNSTAYSGLRLAFADASWHVYDLGPVEDNVQLNLLKESSRDP